MHPIIYPKEQGNIRYISCYIDTRVTNHYEDY